MIIGPLLGANAFVFGNVIGWGAILLFLVAWGALSRRLILRAGAGRWPAGIGAVLAVVWTLAPWLIILAARPA